MSGFFSPWTLAVGCVLVTLGLLGSLNAELWVAALLALPLAVWLLGGKQAYRVLLWVVAVNWLQVVGDVVAADLTGENLSEGFRGTYRVEAIVFSLCAILVLALGMRWGTKLGGWLFRSAIHHIGGPPAHGERGVQLHRILICYFASLAVTQILGAVATMVPAVAQPVLALSLIKFVCVYLIAATIFESGRGYGWLALVSLLEMVIGLAGFFASYKEAFIVMLIALATSRRPMSARAWIFGATAAVAVAWVSLVWTTVKMEYRYKMFGDSVEQRIDWLAQRFFVDKINYHDAAVLLFQRIGYTKLYAAVIARDNAGSLPHRFNFYASAVEHVLTPRLLFPDKAALNDSKITTTLLNVSIRSETSIGVGYVAQAHVDFGFPGLLLPMLAIGLMIGSTAKYFMTRTAPLLIREAFTTATLFLAFPYEEDIDKALGGFITGFLAMALVLKFAYPMIARWLAGSIAGRPLVSAGYIRNMQT